MSQPLQPRPDLGVNAHLRGFRPFPPNDPWNTPVDRLPVDPRSAAILAAIAARNPRAHLHPDFGTTVNGVPNGIPYVVVGQNTTPTRVTFEFAEESDPGPYPIPPKPPIEGGEQGEGDRHILVIDRDRGKLFELYGAYPAVPAGWRAGSGAIFDLVKNTTRPLGWTSADAAGLPIFPGLARFDEVAAGEIRHALRFTLQRSQKAFVAPARHWASRFTDPNLPPMGLRVRLKASTAIATLPPQAKVIARALQVYGMLLADNGSDWFISGAPHPRWDDTQLQALRRFQTSDFEVVATGPLVTPNSK